MRLVTRDHQFQDDEDNFSDRHYRVSYRSPSSSRAGREAIIIRRPSSNSDERYGKDKAVRPTQTDLDAIYNSIHSKDVTVHLELDIVSDLDDELEEFNRLVRQGWFIPDSQEDPSDPL